MAQSNEERVRLANAEIVEKGNMGAVDKVFATDYVVHLGGKEARGTEFVKSSSDSFVRRSRTSASWRSSS